MLKAFIVYSPPIDAQTFVMIDSQIKVISKLDVIFCNWNFIYFLLILTKSVTTLYLRNISTVPFTEDITTNGVYLTNK